MKLNEILSGSAYDLAVFTKYPHHIDDLENAISSRISRKKLTPFVTCYVRNKEIQLKPEEVIRQLYLRVLVNEYGYAKSRIKIEYPISIGRSKKRVDIAIMDAERTLSEYILVELKSPKFNDGKKQLHSYCNATGAPLGVWSNGKSIEYYQRTDPNYFADLKDIPKSGVSLSDFINRRYTILDLILGDKLREKTLKGFITELEDEVLANAGVNVFEESFKLIFTKLYDEFLSGGNMDALDMFVKYRMPKGSNVYDLDKKENNEFYEEINADLRPLDFSNAGTETEVYERIDNLFQDAQRKWKGIFAEGSKFNLSAAHLKICVSYLQNIKLFNSNLDVVDDAFEHLINKDSKGEKGQYFTPRYVIDMCVKMLHPKQHEYLIDTAAGSCGFPMHAIFHVWRTLNPNAQHLLTAQKKTKAQNDYVQEKVFALDFDERTVRVGKTLNLIAGDGKTNVLKLNTLDYERWNGLRKADNWRPYRDGFENLEKLRVDDKTRDGKRNYHQFKFDVLMANPPFAGDIKDTRVLAKYELGEKALNSKKPKMGRDILFIERNLDFLKPGGRMAIVLPQGRFNNASDKRIREYIAERCRILAVVGLHGNTFKPHTGTKTSVLFVQKWDDTLCPKVEDYNIFFATQQSSAKDNSGTIIYETDTNGNRKKDQNNHDIIKHDLFNHGKFILDDGTEIDKGETQDGIAEAFIEFAKKENLSFWSGK